MVRKENRVSQVGDDTLKIKHISISLSFLPTLLQSKSSVQYNRGQNNQVFSQLLDNIELATLSCIANISASF